MLNSPYTVTGGTLNGSAPAVIYPHPSQVLSEETLTGHLRLHRAGPNSTYRILPLQSDGTVHVGLEGRREFSLMPRGHWSGYGREANFRIENRTLEPSGAAGAFTLRDVGEVRTMGTSFVLLYGGTFTLRDRAGSTRQVETGERPNMTMTLTDPSGAWGTRWYDRIVIAVEGSLVDARFGAAEPGRVRIALKTLVGTFDGDFEFDGVAGNTSVNGVDLPPRQSLFQAIGSWSARADYDTASAARWRVQGEATFVGVDGFPVAGNRTAHLPAAVASAAAALTLLALLFALLRALPAVLGLFYSRLTPERLLAHPVRSVIVQVVDEQPGVILRDLVAVTGRSYGVVRHHARVLRSAGRVKILARGKAVHLYPPHHSLPLARRLLLLEVDAHVRFLVERVRGGPQPQARLVQELQRALGIHRTNAWRAVRRALEAGLLHRVPANGQDLLSLESTQT